MEKQQLIHNKWSDLGITLLVNQYDFDGWIDVNELEKQQLTNELNYKEYSESDSDFKTMLCRPKSLQGIENNKGWTKIENESEVPNESGVDFDKQTRFRAGRFTSNGKFCIHLKDTNWFQMDKAYKNNLVTHYQPIEQKPPPLY